MEFVKITSTQNDSVKHVIKLRDGEVRYNERNEHKISAVDLEW